MSDHPVILAIDDEPQLLELVTHQLEPEFSVQTASSGLEGLAKLEMITPALILLDLKMPQMSGIAFLRRLRETGTHIPVVVLTAYGSVDSAVQAIKLGAMDYLKKPFEKGKLRHTVQTLLAGRKRSQDVPSWHSIIGKSPQIQHVWRLVQKYGPTDLSILLYGETGTGKELFARAIHEISKQLQGPFVPIDISTIPESLVESEIFGYERGAFSGATGSKPGRLEWAHEGTLLLDEISNLPLYCQAKLLRVLQEEQYVPLGGHKVKTLDVRLVSTSNIDLGQAIQRGTFREDLYYRINGVTITLPPLRERDGDIELLAHHFVEKYSRKYEKPLVEISDEAMELCLSYRWPGNVRELEHTIARAVVFTDRAILPQHLCLYHSAEVLPVRLDRTAHEPLGVSVFASDGDGVQEIVCTLNFRCDFTTAIDLKQLKHQVAAEVERLVIAEGQKRFSFKKALAEFFDVDPKTLRSIMKR